MKRLLYLATWSTVLFMNTVSAVIHHGEWSSLFDIVLVFVSLLYLFGNIDLYLDERRDANA